MTARVHLLCSAATSAQRNAVFADDAPLDAGGLKGLERELRLPVADAVLRSPALAAAQTAEGLGLDARPDTLLRDCDFGRWAGLSVTDVHGREPEALILWLTDPHAAPHGGESFAEVFARAGAWMDRQAAQPSAVLAITHSLVIRAAIARALGATPAALQHIDVGPLTRAALTFGGGKWKLGALVPPKAAP